MAFSSDKKGEKMPFSDVFVNNKRCEVELVDLRVVPKASKCVLGHSKLRKCQDLTFASYCVLRKIWPTS